MLRFAFGPLYVASFCKPGGELWMDLKGSVEFGCLAPPTFGIPGCGVSVIESFDLDGEMGRLGGNLGAPNLKITTIVISHVRASSLLTYWTISPVYKIA